MPFFLTRPLLRQFASAALLFAVLIAPAHAQSGPVKITQTVAFAKVGGLTPLRVFDAASVAPDGAGARIFQLDFIGKSSALPVFGISALLHIIPDELEITAIENIATAVWASPNAAAPPAVESSDKTINGVSYAHAYRFAWGDFPKFSAFTRAGAYTRLLTATFKLKKSAGATTVDFALADGGAYEVSGSQFTIQGPRAPASP